MVIALTALCFTLPVEVGTFQAFEAHQNEMNSRTFLTKPVQNAGTFYFPWKGADEITKIIYDMSCGWKSL